MKWRPLVPVTQLNFNDQQAGTSTYMLLSNHNCFDKGSQLAGISQDGVDSPYICDAVTHNPIASNRLTHAKGRACRAA